MRSATTSLNKSIACDGHSILPAAVPPERVGRLISELEVVAGGEVHALRDLLSRSAEVRSLAISSGLTQIAESIIGPGAFPARGLLFDKTPTSNWKVAWHQDRTIAVRQRVDVEGFGPWSAKQGVWHVQPPVEILQRMVTLRVHLDDCGVENGPLRVISGSHRFGLLDEKAISTLRDTRDSVSCTGPAGTILIMRPLLLHASSLATLPRRRRVVHLEYAAGELPGGLEWRRPAPDLALCFSR